MNKESIEAEKKVLEEQLNISYKQREQIVIQCHQLEGAIAILTKLLKEEPKPEE